MTDNDGSQDHATPSRSDPQSLIPWARRLYEQGKTREQVVHEIYGVDFPAEVYLLRDADGPYLPLSWLNQPWRIMTPLERGGPKGILLSPWEEQDLINVYAQAPQVVLLMELGEGDATHGESTIGYDLDELRAGRSTVVGIEATNIPESGAEFEVLGPSLLQVLHEWLTDHHRLLAWQLTLESNRGFGSIDDEDVERALQRLRFIEGLQKQLE